MRATWWLPPAEALKNLRATLGILADSRALSRIRFLRAAERIGLIAALHKPATLDEIKQSIGTADTDLLDGLLDVGVAVGELRCRKGRYSLKGNRIRAMASQDAVALRGFTAELADYRGDVYRDLPARLQSGERGPYLDQYDEVVAQGSRLVEPFIARFVRQVVEARPVRTMLEIGCGTGIYVRHAVQAREELSAVAIDMSERAVDLASANFRAWGLAERCAVVHADIRDSDRAELAGPFDMITLHNNIYYFSPAEWPSLLADLRRRLAPTGRLILTSMFAGNSLAAAELDLVLRATAGCWPLPERAELADALTDAGYRAVAFQRLLATDPLFGVVAEAGPR
ncbi:type 12 methyltransferase [Syntrophobacter fumaroxidans MPOB] [Mycobacterium shimoidei]|uniref:Type 12 methyltransferase [Syntrophobacter fumaroxidans MPOB] n=1 Tax=Mycobacterium shimoidei TaxID=29313 RepID=A0A375Z1M2_MYCSH|nr:class I SAM-dependent methyltransferase [Mycobacterium shimoidei]SRX94977.1 type 12 methyltransferase [Syntrophobacter fumaroxidans MPOB] [Mycobacterium shimoidei]